MHQLKTIIASFPVDLAHRVQTRVCNLSLRLRQVLPLANDNVEIGQVVTFHSYKPVIKNQHYCFIPEIIK